MLNESQRETAISLDLLETSAYRQFVRSIVLILFSGDDFATGSIFPAMPGDWAFAV
jgi:hypothetical protein